MGSLPRSALWWDEEYFLGRYHVILDECFLVNPAFIRRRCYSCILNENVSASHCGRIMNWSTAPLDKVLLFFLSLFTPNSIIAMYLLMLIMSKMVKGICLFKIAHLFITNKWVIICIVLWLDEVWIVNFFHENMFVKTARKINGLV